MRKMIFVLGLASFAFAGERADGVSINVHISSDTTHVERVSVIRGLPAKKVEFVYKNYGVKEARLPSDILIEKCPNLMAAATTIDED